MNPINFVVTKSVLGRALFTNYEEKERGNKYLFMLRLESGMK